MTKNVDFIFDFASPNAYLVHKVLPDFAKRTGASFHYIPCLLGGIFKQTNNQAPMLAFGDIPNKLAYEGEVIARFIARHGLDKFKMNPHFPINTVQLMRATLVAEAEDKLMPFIDAMVKAMWEDGLHLGDAEVLEKAMSDSGFDGAHYIKTISDPAIKQKLIDNTQNATERGAFGIPSFFYNGQMFFGKDHMHELEHYLSQN